MKYLIVFIVIQLSIRTFGCSCNGVDPISEANIVNYTIVFKGEVLSIKEDKFQKIIKFKIEKLYKGKWKEDTISIYTASSETACRTDGICRTNLVDVCQRRRRAGVLDFYLF